VNNDDNRLPGRSTDGKAQQIHGVRLLALLGRYEIRGEIHHGICRQSFPLAEDHFTAGGSEILDETVEQGGLAVSWAARQEIEAGPRSECVVQEGIGRTKFVVSVEEAGIRPC